MSGPSPGKLIGDWNRARGRSLDPAIGTESYMGPMNYSTGASSINNGVVSIDPTIRAMRESSLQDYLGNNADIRAQFMGVQSPFVESILNPMRQDIAARRGALQRSLGMRRLGGSSFGEQALTNQRLTGQRELADASAQAQMLNLSTLQGIDQSAFQASNTVAAQNLAQELSALGLGRDQINQLLANFQNQQARELQSQALMNQQLQAIDTSAQNWMKLSMTKSGSGGGW